MLKDNLINFLKKNNLDYLLVNSTNEFLVEYNELSQNARYYLTGFAGSTGEALLCKNGRIWQFADGRYHKQADNQVFDGIEVVKLALGEAFLPKMIEKIPQNSSLGIVSNKVSLSFFNNIQKAAVEKNIKIIPLNYDPVFEFIETKESKQAEILDIPIDIAGVSTEKKIANLQKDLKDDEALLVTTLEDIAWIMNKRSFAQNFSSYFKAKLIIEKNGYRVFYENELDNCRNYLKNSSKTFLYSPKNISYGDFSIIKNHSRALEKNKIEEAKSVKNDFELAHMKKCFERTDRAVTRVSDYVNSAEKLTEQELIKLVEREFFKEGATSLSFNTILASGKNSALAHYAADMTAETPIKKGDLVLLDCGAFFEGGYATDITRVFCFKEPSQEAKRLYTTVLRANLNAYHINVTPDISGYDIDKIARNVIDEANLKNYAFNHATGHGVGISVHEFPPSISMSELAKAPLKDGMTFTIEPGAYNPEFGGVRLENSVYFKNGEIKSFSKVRFEEKLIDYSLLNDKEKEWLKNWQDEAIK